MTHISLDKLTVWELDHAAMVSLAAELGYQAIGLFANASHAHIRIEPPISDQAAKRELKQRLADTGIAAHNIEYFSLDPDTDLSRYVPALEFGAELGARHATALISDPDEGRAFDNYARLVEIGSRLGLSINVEFMVFSHLKNIHAAVQMVQKVAHPAAGIVVDVLHLMRSGGSVADVAAVADASPGLIRYAQICDGPAQMEPDGIVPEAIEQRQIPGSGAFPLREFLDALPKDVVVGIETPLKSLREQGVSPRERARLIDAGLRKIIGPRL